MIIKAYKYCGLIVKPANCPPLVLNQLMKLRKSTYRDITLHSYYLLPRYSTVWLAINCSVNQSNGAKPCLAQHNKMRWAGPSWPGFCLSVNTSRAGQTMLVLLSAYKHYY